MASLTTIMTSNQVDDSARLYAAVVAKNAISSKHWRPGSHLQQSLDWTSWPVEERHHVRQAVLQHILTEPRDSVALQMTLFLAQIVKEDFPGDWPDVIDTLLHAGAWAQTTPPAAKCRALVALKHSLKALRGMRRAATISLIPRQLARAGQGAAEMTVKEVMAKAKEVAMAKTARFQAAFREVREQWRGHVTALLQRGEYWKERGALSIECAKALQLLFNLLPGVRHLEPDLTEVLKEMSEHVAALSQVFVQVSDVQLQDSSTDEGTWYLLCSRSFERVTQCAGDMLERHPIAFAPFVAPFLHTYCQGAILAIDGAKIHQMRPKKRVHMTHFICKLLYQQMYFIDFGSHAVVAPDEVIFSVDGSDDGSDLTVAQMPGLSDAGSEPGSSANALRERVSSAKAAVDGMLSGGVDGACGQLMSAVVQKYIAMTQDELQEWLNDPEGLARSMEVERLELEPGDFPRTSGVQLIVAMLDRGREAAAKTLVELAGRVQKQQMTPDTVLLLEALYRCIGAEYSIYMRSHVHFPSWYQSELRQQLTQPAPDSASDTTTRLCAAILRARAVWLVGQCSSHLTPELWQDAFGAVGALLTSEDTVVALTAVEAAMLMTQEVISLQLEVKQLDKFLGRGDKVAVPHMGGVNSPQFGDLLEEVNQQQQESAVQQEAATRRALFDSRQAVLSQQLEPVVHSVLALLRRLSDVESMVTVLHLLSFFVEGLGTKTLPHLGIIADMLPKVWQYASERRATAGTTGVVLRLHSQLISILLHLLRKLRGQALGDARLLSVLWPLLQHVVAMHASADDGCLEEGLDLVVSCMEASPQIPPEIHQLLPHILGTLQRGQDNVRVYTILVAYCLQGGLHHLAPHLGTITQAINDSLTQVVTQAEQRANRLESASGHAQASPQSLVGVDGAPRSRPRGQQAAMALSEETIREAHLAANVAHLLLLQAPAESGPALHTCFRTMLHTLTLPYFDLARLPALRLSARFLPIFEAYFEAICELLRIQPAAAQQLLDNDVRKLADLINRWMRFAQAKGIGETFGLPPHQYYGRLKRRNFAIAVGQLAVTGVALDLLAGQELLQGVVTLLLTAVIEQPRYMQYFKQMHVFSVEDLEGDQFTHALLQLERNSAVHVSDVTELCRSAVGALGQRVGQEALVGVMPRDDMKADLMALLNGEQLPSVRQEEERTAKLMAAKGQPKSVTLLVGGDG